MIGAQDLISLPEEVLGHISKFLELPDLLAFSATCQRLRAALNCNTVWRPYSRGGAISQGLKGLTSIVEPPFTEPQDLSNSLEPLCEHRLHFSRQSRLLNNYRRGKYVMHSLPFNHYLADFETSIFFSQRTITYKDKYLFAIGYSCDYLNEDDANTLDDANTSNDTSIEEVKVCRIEGDPCFLTTFKMVRHHGVMNYPIIMSLEVVEDKLVVRQDNMFDVYEIRLPDIEFPLLHMINVAESLPQVDGNIIVVRDLIFVENHSASNSNPIQLWSIHTGTRLPDISPKIEGSDFKICNHPWNQQDILLCVEMLVGQSSLITPHLFIYNLNTFQYTNFYAIVPTKIVPTNPLTYFGFLDSQYVALIKDNENSTSHIFVFDIKSSALLAQNVIKSSNVSESFIISGCLAIPNLTSLQVINLSNLETVWQIEFGSSNYYFNRACHINIFNLCHFIIVKTPHLTEVWDFEKRKKCLDLPGIRFIALSGYFSKLILLKDSFMEMLTFW